MSSQTIGLLIGGVLPAIFFGLSGVFAKASNAAGIGLGYYLLAIGFAVVLAGLICLGLIPDRSISFASARDAFLSGVVWAGGAAFVAVALARYRTPLSQLVPLYNMNTLVAVLLGLWIFSEWQEINPAKLLVGSVLIVVGGVLVALA